MVETKIAAGAQEYRTGQVGQQGRNRPRDYLDDDRVSRAAEKSNIEVTVFVVPHLSHVFVLMPAVVLPAAMMAVVALPVYSSAMVVVLAVPLVAAAMTPLWADAAASRH